MGCAGWLADSADENSGAPDVWISESLRQPIWDVALQAVGIELDWVEGAKPCDQSIDSMKGAIEAYCPHASKVEVQWGVEIPARDREKFFAKASAWEQGPRILSSGPGNWRDRFGVSPGDTDASEPRQGTLEPIPQSTLLLWVISDNNPEWYGVLGYSFRLRRQCGIGIRLNRPRVEDETFLCYTTARIESRTLVHELGHHLGLVHNPSHRHSGHCTHPSCVMYGGSRASLKFVLANALPGMVGQAQSSYCGDCEEDLRRTAGANSTKERYSRPTGHLNALPRRRVPRTSLLLDPVNAPRAELGSQQPIHLAGLR